MSTPKTKRRSTVTARRFFDLVVLVLGERTSFTADTPVPMADVQEEVLRRSDLTDRERKAHDDKFIKRRIEFAFRNRRAEYVNGIDALTVLAGGSGGQWALTEAGVEKARRLADGVADPVVAKPAKSAKVAKAKKPAKVEAEAVAAPEPEEVEATKAEAAEVLPPEPEEEVEETKAEAAEAVEAVEAEAKAEELPPEPKPPKARKPRTLSAAVSGS